eukprot:4976558-Pyramimonas_sp.AAC.1
MVVVVVASTSYGAQLPHRHDLPRQRPGNPARDPRRDLGVPERGRARPREQTAPARSRLG